MNVVLRLIRMAMPPTRPAVIVAGLGRCGTTMVHDSIVESSLHYRRARAFAADLAHVEFKKSHVYKTHDYPPSQLPDFVKVIFMFGNPMDAAISGYRAFWGGKHYLHVKSPYSSEHHRIFEKDVLLMERHFDQWMQHQPFTFLSVRYESIFDEEVGEMLSAYLGVVIALPSKQLRRADWRCHPERHKLESTYRSLAYKVREAPSVKLWLPPPTRF